MNCDNSITCTVSQQACNCQYTHIRNSSPWQAKGSLGWWRWSSTGSPPVGSDLRLWPGCYPCGRTQSPSTPPWPDQFEKTPITSEKVHTLLSISQGTADRKITRNNKKHCLGGKFIAEKDQFCGLTAIYLLNHPVDVQTLITVKAAYNPSSKGNAQKLVS